MIDFDQSFREWQEDPASIHPISSYSDDSPPEQSDRSVDIRDKSLRKLRDAADAAVDNALAPAHLRGWISIDHTVSKHTLPDWALIAAELERALSQVAFRETKTSGSNRFYLPADTISLIQKSVPAFVATDEFLYSGFEFSPVPEKLTDNEVSDLIYDQLGMMFSAYARRLAQIGEVSVQISSHGEFLPEIDIMLQYRIPFPPRRFAILSDQIFQQMMLPGVIKTLAGNWGDFEYDQDGDITMNVALEPVSFSEENHASIVIEEF